MNRALVVIFTLLVTCYSLTAYDIEEPRMGNGLSYCRKDSLWIFVTINGDEGIAHYCYEEGNTYKEIEVEILKYIHAPQLLIYVTGDTMENRLAGKHQYSGRNTDIYIDTAGGYPAWHIKSARIGSESLALRLPYEKEKEIYRTVFK